MKSRKGQQPGNRTQPSLHARIASIVICPAHGHFPQMSGLCIKTYYSPRLMAGSDVMVAWCCDSCVVLTMTGVLRELEPEQSVPRSPHAISRVTAPTAAHCQCRERERSVLRISVRVIGELTEIENWGTNHERRGSKSCLSLFGFYWLCMASYTLKSKQFAVWFNFAILLQ